MSNQKTIQLPTTTNELREAIKTAIEFYQGSPAKNENKLNEALAASLNLANYDTLSALLKEDVKEVEKTKWIYDIERNMGFSLINDVKINENVFDNVDVAFCIVDKDDRIDEMYRWIGENLNDSSKAYMVSQWKELIAYLERSKEEYVLEGIENSEFIAFDLEPKEFNEACAEILEANEKYKTENHKLAEKIVKEKNKLFIDTDTGMVEIGDVYIDFDAYMPFSLNFSYRDDNGMPYIFDWDIEYGLFEDKGNGEYVLKYDIDKEGELLISIL